MHDSICRRFAFVLRESSLLTIAIRGNLYQYAYVSIILRPPKQQMKHYCQSLHIGTSSNDLWLGLSTDTIPIGGRYNNDRLGVTIDHGASSSASSQETDELDSRILSGLMSGDFSNQTAKLTRLTFTIEHSGRSVHSFAHGLGCQFPN